MMIFFETANQAHIFLLLLYAGMAAGGLYDIFSFFRRRSKRALVILLDFVYAVMVGALCFFALAMGGEDALRFYALLGIFCGALLYSLGIRHLAAGAIRFFSRKRIKME